MSQWIQADYSQPAHSNELDCHSRSDYDEFESDDKFESYLYIVSRGYMLKKRDESRTSWCLGNQPNNYWLFSRHDGFRGSP